MNKPPSFEKESQNAKLETRKRLKAEMELIAAIKAKSSAKTAHDQ